jgi:pimeloyl-ACP methyl ester carboxylesterase
MTTPWTELVMREVAGAELRIVPGVGHFAQIEDAGNVTQWIAEFADRVGTERGIFTRRVEMKG